MSLNDPIADMLTRMRNAIQAGHQMMALPNSNIKVAIAKILKDEGYITAFEIVEGKNADQKTLRIRLKYLGDRRDRKPVISGLLRVRRPGKRVYAKKEEIPWVLSGLGVSILSTPKGVMTGKRARQLGVGGEVICNVW